MDADGPGELHFTRGAWTVVTCFVGALSGLPPGQVVLSSGPLLADGRLGPNTTAWVVSERT